MKKTVLLTALLAAVITGGCGGNNEAAKMGKPNVERTETVNKLVEETVEAYTDYKDRVVALIERDSPDNMKYLEMPAINEAFLAEVKDELGPLVDALSDSEQQAYYLAILDNDLGMKDKSMLAVEQSLRGVTNDFDGNKDAIQTYVTQVLNGRAQIAEWKFDPLELFLSLK